MSAQLKQYDTAFGKFLLPALASDGITRTIRSSSSCPDENDHFVGGAPEPSALRRRPRALHLRGGPEGEINASLNRLLITQRANSTAFSVHSDDAPTVLISTAIRSRRCRYPTMEHEPRMRWSPPIR